ncbi:helix-turn-helix domain-containing protein [Modestobacter sp. I12A-02628]|uniref:Helix-turn-helix transcriptional regulator n=1 Tax=Goekera deserti TaxID=2497753 RepID=A0A7K3WGQ0_9ACTN|nr:helix-turn-helix transcriptional regulator [Goekera deserti]MPQ99368.1 helix-turn-helix domain-containing protein [Goekera deserti]NDI50367.1 helix-turn-helix domain-containing protein [Goekera deserti]NEL55675.1 helix-turn-helix transcriptional regulator [Goekera deserti]
MTDDLLADYLRARRGQVRPDDVGLPRVSGTDAVARRRVQGLRREEVALLAGISVDYYLRLEQGRAGTPSPQVVRSLARALRLDETAAAYLSGLAAPTPATAPTSTAHEERVPSSVENLVHLMDWPAFVTGRNFDVLVANSGAAALSPELTPGKNRLRSFFLVAAERELYRDWEDTARRFVAVVRDTLGREAARADFSALVRELSEGSDSFRRLWELHDVVARDAQSALLQHPVAGALQLNLERLTIAGLPEQSLVVYHPTIGSSDAQRLADLLATSRVPRHVSQQRADGPGSSGSTSLTGPPVDGSG